MFTCNKCFNLFNKTKIQEEGGKCPIHACRGKVWDIDEIILPVIIELSKKGYTTTSCCSGHFDDPDSKPFYIQFDLSVGKDKLIALPAEYEIHSDEEFLEISLKDGVRSSDKIDCHKEILSSAVTLIEWAKSLPQIYEFAIKIETVTEGDAFEVGDILKEEFNFGYVGIEDQDETNQICTDEDIPSYIVRGYTKTYIKDDPELKSKISKATSAFIKY